MCDFRPEDCTTFWTWATYFVTEASTPTGLEDGGRRHLERGRNLQCSVAWFGWELPLPSGVWGWWIQGRRSAEAGCCRSVARRQRRGRFCSLYTAFSLKDVSTYPRKRDRTFKLQTFIKLIAFDLSIVASWTHVFRREIQVSYLNIPSQIWILKPPNFAFYQNGYSVSITKLSRPPSNQTNSDILLSTPMSCLLTGAGGLAISSDSRLCDFLISRRTMAQWLIWSLLVLRFRQVLPTISFHYAHSLSSWTALCSDLH